MIDELEVELQGQKRILMLHFLLALPLPLTILEWDSWSNDTLLQVWCMKFAVDIFSSSVSMLICSQFGCQVSILGVRRPLEAMNTLKTGYI